MVDNCSLLPPATKLLPPATKLGQGYVFTRVCDSVHGLGGAWPGGVPGPGGAWSRGCLVLVLGGPGGDPPGTATAAGGTHPTGMHSCWNKLLLTIYQPF